VVGRTLWLSGIPVYDPEKGEYFQLTDEDFKRVSKDLKEAISQDLHKQVIGLAKAVKMTVQLAPVVDDLGMKSLELRSAEELMETYRALRDEPVTRCWRRCSHWWYKRKCRNYDAKVKELTNKRNEILGGKKRIAGSAFVTFEDKAHCDHFLKARPHCIRCRAHAYFTFGKPPFTSVTLQCARAPHPSDMNWANLHIRAPIAVLRFIIATTLLVFAMVMLVTPVTISSQIDLIIPAIRQRLKVVEKMFSDHQVREEAEFWVEVSRQLPAMLLVVINSVVLPDCIRRVASTARAVRYSSMEVIQLHLNYIFLILNTILIPFLGLSSIGALVEWGRHRMSAPFSLMLPRIIRTMMGSSGALALRYILNCAFVTNTSSLLQFPQLLCRAYSRRVARTPRECVEAEEKIPFAWGYWYAWELSIFTMAICLSSAVPCVLPCATIFFGLQRVVDRHNLLSGVYAVGAQAENLFIIRVLHYMRGIIALWWFLMGFGFIITLKQVFGVVSYDHWDYRSRHFLIKASACMLISSAVLICFCSWWHLQKYLHDSQFQIVDVAERGLLRACCPYFFGRKRGASDYRNIQDEDYESDFGEWEKVENKKMGSYAHRLDSPSIEERQEDNGNLQWDARSALVYKCGAI